MWTGWGAGGTQTLSLNPERLLSVTLVCLYKFRCLPLSKSSSQSFPVKVIAAAAANVIVFLSVLGVLKPNYCD